MITETDVLNVIVSGMMDDSLTEIYEACLQRRRSLNQQRDLLALASIKKGDNVRIVKISPKYLNGIVVKVTGKQGKNLIVDFSADDWRAGKFCGVKGARVPAGTVEKVTK